MGFLYLQCAVCVRCVCALCVWCVCVVCVWCVCVVCVLVWGAPRRRTGATGAL